MSRILSEGFELGVYSWGSSGPSLASGTPAPHSGVYYLSYSSGGYISRGFPLTIDPLTGKPISSFSTDIYYRFAFRRRTGSSEKSIFALGWSSTRDAPVRYLTIAENIGTGFTVHLGPDYSGTKIAQSKIIPTIDKWYVIEGHFILDAVNGLHEFKVDGEIQCANYEGDTRYTSYSLYDYRYLINNAWIIGGSSALQHWDDIAINFNDGSGANDGWCGDGRTIRCVPNGNGDSSQWVGSDGNSTDNYLLIDETPVNTTDYVGATISGYTDLYNVESLSETPIAINTLWVEAYGIQLNADNKGTNLGIKTNSVEYWSPPVIYETGGYTVEVSSGWDVNPYTSSGWDTSAITSLQIGARIAE